MPVVKNLSIEEAAAVLGRLARELRPRVLEAAAGGVYVRLRRHFLARQAEPRKDGFPMQGFWYGNGGFSVVEKMDAPEVAESGAVIRIHSAALAHKMNPNPPPIVPGAGRKYLALPAIAAAAGKSPRDFPGLRFAYVLRDSHAASPLSGVSRSAPHGGGRVASRGAGPAKGRRPAQGRPALVRAGVSAAEVVFWLARSVRTPHDPRAMPPDGELASAASVSAAAAAASLARGVFSSQ